MSNRRRIRGVDYRGSVVQEVSDRFQNPLPGPAPGEHQWIVIAMFRVSDPSAERHEMDRENLLTVDGPGCLVCEMDYGEAGDVCPGAPAHV